MAGGCWLARVLLELVAVSWLPRISRRSFANMAPLMPAPWVMLEVLVIASESALAAEFAVKLNWEMITAAWDESGASRKPAAARKRPYFDFMNFGALGWLKCLDGSGGAFDWQNAENRQSCLIPFLSLRSQISRFFRTVSDDSRETPLVFATESTSKR